MTNIKWEFADDVTPEITPYTILKDFARRIGPDTRGMFMADIVQTLRDEGMVVCSFYIVVPQLRNYSYKLMEMIQDGFVRAYPVRMYLYGQAKENILYDVATNPDEFRSKVSAFITNPLTKLILTSLRTQVEIYGDYKREDQIDDKE
jgi:hypothetical protein